MRASFHTRSCVPLPWCTSQSTISTRDRPHRCSAACAAITTLLSRQNPIARVAVAWWPGGRTTAKAGVPSSAERAAAIAAPAACTAAFQLSAPTTVSASTRPPPRATMIG